MIMEQEAQILSYLTTVIIIDALPSPLHLLLAAVQAQAPPMPAAISVVSAITMIISMNTLPCCLPESTAKARRHLPPFNNASNRPEPAPLFVCSLPQA